MAAALVASAAGCGGGDRPADGFVFPLEGRLNADFYYVQHVDHAAGSGVEDYHCGPKTYDGHTGTDIALPSFEAMDDGVAIVAAARGEVVETHDGEPDRNVSWDGQSGLGNYVALAHDDGTVTYYGHMMNGSLTVDVGDDVGEGAELGQVGSSGRSDIPHLHFEVTQGADVVDPYAGPCGIGDSLWADQDAYDDDFGLVDRGVTDETLTGDPDFALLKAPPPRVTTFATDGGTLWAWVLIRNSRSGDAAQFAIYAPDGSPFDAIDVSPDGTYSASWWFIYYPIPGNFTTLGTWRVDYEYLGEVAGTVEFELVSGGGAIASAPSIEPGFGGGR